MIEEKDYEMMRLIGRRPLRLLLHVVARLLSVNLVQLQSPKLLSLLLSAVAQRARTMTEGCAVLSVTMAA